MEYFGAGGTKSVLAVLLAVLLAGCAAGPAANSPVESRALLSLPTSVPTVAPSPVSTRVMPVDVLTPAPTMTITPIPDETLGLVVEVIDGETLAVVLDGDPAKLAYTVKYLGIDAPPNSPDEPWGVVAYETNRRLANLKVVRLVRDRTDFDDDGYMLRYVYSGNQLLNAQLVEQGLARAAINPPDDALADDILAAEAAAKADELGLWSGQDPTPTPESQPLIATEPAITQTVQSTATAEITSTITITPVTTTPPISVTATVTATVTVTPTTRSSATPTATSTEPASTPTTGPTRESSSGLQGPG